ncbi:IS5 family transposase [Neoroseomonas oryzicola]|uniref:IS5 family transposase n=1 Tax=Neoroseomonas oryzicola TaxID=535904 RepID=A0A9X9WPD9_9PROT|nr:IS5 family transposase [Neoroseomonas oryzicola]MBR0662199.1 IS5 family transposase [Neoroseomonas oryzicola]NKE20220.1 IS5 family transposase [Neoroseomonas oryzicola]
MPTPPFLLSVAQMRRLSPHFPLSHGIPRVDDRRVLSGIIYVIRHGMQWRDAPTAYGPHKTLYNRFIRWSRMGVFDRIFAALAAEGGPPGRLMIDSTHLKAHRTAASLLQKGLFPRCIGRTKGGLNSKLHAACDGQGRPVVLLLTEGQASDHLGAALMLPRLPAGARELIADRGYDSARFRDALITQGIAPCIPSTRSRKQPIPHDALLYRQRHRIEIMFGRLKDWRRIAMRYDRCAHAFFSAITLAATVTFWLNQ